MSKAWCLLLLACLTSCGVRTRSLTPKSGVERVWRPSFVVLIGLDRDAPEHAPATCRKLGMAEVESPSSKVSFSDELRAAARRLGGNAVADIVQVSAPDERPLLYAGTVLQCPWFAGSTEATARELTPSHHGASTCTRDSLARFEPSVGAIAERKFGEEHITVSAVQRAFELQCGARSAARCYDDATAKASRLDGDGGVRVMHRTITQGERVGLSLDGSETSKVYPTAAEKVRDIRRLEGVHQSVKIVSIGRALDPDWSVVDVLILAEPQARELAVLDAQWTFPPTSLRRLVEAVHVLVDELAQRDIVLLNDVELFDALGERVVASLGGDGPTSGQALLGAMASYPALDDTGIEAAFTVSLRTRCRLDFED